MNKFEIKYQVDLTLFIIKTRIYFLFLFKIKLKKIKINIYTIRMIASLRTNGNI